MPRFTHSDFDVPALYSGLTREQILKLNSKIKRTLPELRKEVLSGIGPTLFRGSKSVSEIEAADALKKEQEEKAMRDAEASGLVAEMAELQKNPEKNWKRLREIEELLGWNKPTEKYNWVGK